MAKSLYHVNSTAALATGVTPEICKLVSLSLDGRTRSVPLTRVGIKTFVPVNHTCPIVSQFDRRGKINCPPGEVYYYLPAADNTCLRSRCERLDDYASLRGASFRGYRHVLPRTGNRQLIVSREIRFSRDSRDTNYVI